MTRILVLGAGMVGTIIAADLGEEPGFRVTLVDRSPAALAAASTRCNGRIQTREADLSDPQTILALAKEHDAVAGALASHLGLRALEAVIDAGKPYCDISFMPEDAWTRDGRARAAGVTAVVDCGVAPGMSNLLAGAGVLDLDEPEDVEILVGGLPRERRFPYQYKAGFAPADVIEEYVRPARIVEHGRIVVREALTQIEPVDFDGVGTLEAFNTDGLRSLAYTLKVPNMREKTLRYPGHVALMAAFRATGLFSAEPITVKGMTIRPLDLTSELLFPKWKYEEGEEDLTVMRVTVKGRKEGRPAVRRWDLHDLYDRRSLATSMSRTTAFPCAIILREILAGRITEKGVLPPEKLAPIPGLVGRVLSELARRGVVFHAVTQG